MGLRGKGPFPETAFFFFFLYFLLFFFFFVITKIIILEGQLQNLGILQDIKDWGNGAHVQLL